MNPKLNLLRFGAIQKVDYKPGGTEAFIQYESIDAAQVKEDLKDRKKCHQ